jgi:hypothetical protein
MTAHRSKSAAVTMTGENAQYIATVIFRGSDCGIGPAKAKLRRAIGPDHFHKSELELATDEVLVRIKPLAENERAMSPCTARSGLRSDT